MSKNDAFIWMLLLSSKENSDDCNLLWAEKGYVATIFCKVTTISHFKSGKLYMHLSLKYMHNSSHYILLSSTKIHAHTVYFPSKNYGKILRRKINCISSFYLAHLTAIAMARFCKKKKKKSSDYKKETKRKAAFACAIWNDIQNQKISIKQLQQMQKLQGQSNE